MRTTQSIRGGILMHDVIRVGIVSSIDYDKGFVQVTYPDRENAVSGKLPYFSYWYQMPEVGDKVVVLYLTNGNHEGFVLGKYYHESNLPIKTGKGLLHKPLHQNGAEIQYQEQTDSFALKAGKIAVDGTAIKLSGNALTLSGGTCSMDTDGRTMKIKATEAIVEADSIVLNAPNIMLNGTNISLQGDSITLQGKTETQVIA